MVRLHFERRQSTFHQEISPASALSAGSIERSFVSAYRNDTNLAKNRRSYKASAQNSRDNNVGSQAYAPKRDRIQDLSFLSAIKLN